MVASMTAFARHEDSGDWGQAIWEMRSVNHRYLDLTLRLPEELRALENAIREHISARVKRGKLDCQLRFSSTVAGLGEIAINDAVATNVVRAVEHIAGILREPAPVSSLEILRWPGVIMDTPTDLDPLRGPLLESLDATLAQFLETRRREGDKLRNLLLERCDGMAGQIDLMRAQLPGILDALLERLRARVRDLATEVDEGRIEQEMLLLTQKLDVAEEMDRLEAHLQEFRHILASDQPMGRRLDFLLQEMNREANTLGSKSSHSEGSKVCVELKVLIEQMREQIQNIE